MLKTIIQQALIASCLACWAAASQAGVILAPNSVQSNVPSRSGTSLVSIIDASGLSSGYTSGVTDFDTYIASGPTHDNLLTTSWGTATGTTAAQLIFNLGPALSIDAFGLWNRGFSTQGVRDFTLSSCSDATCASSVLLGSYSATAVLGSLDATLPEVFSFTSTVTSYVSMDIRNIYGSCCVTFGEVAFRGGDATVPEPATVALFGLGLAAIGYRRRIRA